MGTVTGGMRGSELKKTINDSTIGKLNKYIEIVRTYIEEELDAKHRSHTTARTIRAAVPSRMLLILTAGVCIPLGAHSGADIIQDRLVFAASNYKPLKQLRDAWAAEASTWMKQYNSLKRGYEREVERVRAAEAIAASVGAGRKRGAGADPPAKGKRMRVRSAQMAKEKHKGSLTVNPGDTCIFIEACTNPLWSFVKMDDDGRTGNVPASKLEDVPEEAEEMADPSDDDLEDPSDDDAQQARDEAFVEATHADEAAALENDAAECGYTD
eukprot:7381976-Prymnesium_polylepis.1